MSEGRYLRANEKALLTNLLFSLLAGKEVCLLVAGLSNVPQRSPDNVFFRSLPGPPSEAPPMFIRCWQLL